MQINIIGKNIFRRRKSAITDLWPTADDCRQGGDYNSLYIHTACTLSSYYNDLVLSVFIVASIKSAIYFRMFIGFYRVTI